MADAYADENADVQDAVVFALRMISAQVCGYHPTKGWSSRESEQAWHDVWMSGELDGFGAKTLEERQELISRWKKWYQRNVIVKGKI